MAGGLKIAALLAPHQGVDGDSGAAAVRRDRAPVLRNFLPGNPGRIVMRGPTTNSLSSSVENPRALAGFITLANGKSLVYPRVASASNTREPWDARIYPHVTAADLAQGELNGGYEIDLLLSAYTAVANARNATPSQKYDFWGQYVYACAYDGVNDTASAANPNDGVKIQNTFYYRRTQIIRRDVSAVAGTIFTLAGATGAPPAGAVDIKFFTGRMFLAGGALNNAGTETTMFFNHLWYSNPMASVAGGVPATAADWIDPVTAANNTILVGNDEPHDAIIGLARQGKNLVVFKRNTTHLLTGAGPSTYAVRALSQDIGCIDPRSIAEIAGHVFWLSRHGFMIFDGSNITNVSAGVHDAAVASAISGRERTDATEGLTGGITMSSRLDNENVLVTICREQFDNGASPRHQNNYTLIFNVLSRAWTYLTFDESAGSGIFDASDGPLRHSTSPDGNRTHAYGNIDDAATPHQIVAAVKWSTPEASADLWAAYMGSDSTRAIPAEWKSHMVQLASPGYKATVKRIMLEYTFQVNGDDDEAADGWLVSLIDETGTVVVPEFAVTTQQDPPLEPASRRFRQDVSCEANAVQLRVRYNGAARQIMTASILGAWIEYQAAQESHV